jgi:acyl carrier protein
MNAMVPPTHESVHLQNEIALEVIVFLKNEVLNNPGAEISVDNHIVSEGLIDSMGIVRLLVHLQRSYAIKSFDYSDMTLDNFRTVRHIAAMVARYC